MAILIQFSPNSLGGVRLRSEALLARYDSTRFYHSRYRLRPPVGAYNVSISQIWPTFIDVLRLLENAVAKRSFLVSDDWDRPLLEKLERLLYTLFEHCED